MKVALDQIPLYEELPAVEKTGDRYVWDVFGRDDELGTLNFIGPEQIQLATSGVTKGRVVNLSLPLDLPSPALTGSRGDYVHHVESNRQGRDDRLDNFYLQCSSHWDSLQHVRYSDLGLYGGRTDEDVDRGALGIDTIARHGLMSRGVLIDAARYFAEQRQPIGASQRVALTTEMMDQILDWEGVALQQGDIVLVRTGWLTWYLALNQAGREAQRDRMFDPQYNCPGVAAGVNTAAWLWNRRVAAVAADNPTFEVLPAERGVSLLHRLLIPLMGMPIGEFWLLDDLSEACRELRRYHFLLVSAPLNLPRGVGSPSNAYAVL